MVFKQETTSPDNVRRYLIHHPDIDDSSFEERRFHAKDYTSCTYLLFSIENLTQNRYSHSEARPNLGKNYTIIVIVYVNVSRI